MANKEIKPNMTELNDEPLENVNGGVTRQLPTCPKCGRTLQTAKCPHCDHKMTLIILK